MPEVPARPYIGGQAVIEGVMMRSPGSISIVCRRQSGELVVRERPVVEQPGGFRKLPFIRGIATVVESLKMGSEALRWSAKLYEEDLIAQEEAGRSAPAPKGPGLLSMLALSMVALATQEDGKTHLPGAPEARTRPVPPGHHARNAAGNRTATERERSRRAYKVRGGSYRASTAKGEGRGDGTKAAEPVGGVGGEKPGGK